MRNNCLYFTLLITLIILTSVARAQERISLSANSDWQFYKGKLSYPALLTQQISWEKVQIPHSWNTTDVNDDVPGYYRGSGWYKKHLVIPANWKNRKVFLSFEGANQTTVIFVNGKKAGTHIGGYTGFNVDVSPFLRFDQNGKNEITIQVDNRYNANIPPLSADFTFFGGLYRDVYLTVAGKTHFNIDKYGGKGVFITTPLVSDEKASVSIKGDINNAAENVTELIVTATLKYKNRVIAEQKKQLKSDGLTHFELNFEEINNPKLWSPTEPNLYQLITTIRNAKTGELLDQVSNPLGFRWFKFDAAKGFFLNGKPLKLIGASRHQDYKNLGNAVGDEIAIKDVRLLKEMGGNFLRVAHYPQDPAVLAACDQLGLLAAVEIPVVNAITETEAFANNSKNMQREMIRQNYNHPSVIIWAYMNEVLLRPPFANDSTRREVYFKNVFKLAQELENLTREEDPNRYTMIPNHGNFALYNRIGLTKIPMLVGWNLYQGWYTGKYTGFATFLDMHHRLLPDKPLLVTEYGADADSRIHSEQPLRFDKSVEYAVQYHEFYLKAMLERPFVAAAMAWNLADFNSEERVETDPHINNKGLLTIDRKPKDTYLFYQANLLTVPFIKIGLTGRTVLGGVADGNNEFRQQIKVYSNQKTVSLAVNGVPIGKQTTSMGIANFTVTLLPGSNTLIATTGHGKQDQVEVVARLIPKILNSETLPFSDVNISLGDTRYFLAQPAQELWIPEQAYTKGSWGYVGGTRFSMTDTSRLSFGSNKNILGTALDPVYQTQRIGMDAFIFDVPDGEYELTLHFAELVSSEPQKALAYDLGAKTTVNEQFKERNFDVAINGKTMIANLGNKNELKAAEAHSYKVKVTATHNSGIKINFKPILDEAIINGIQLKKIY
ncbi:glycoside hydrolase family 2 TIM barrel-domain containing protein [Pedobacter insulae]|uniref:Beta-galactosidase n=1 Tax=Pedobacter insulae TaxID=414048 RepID=A0A1I2WH02_9SPHI|nr:glycoside hydrolase family 2 TIM barrel-domain containing protein [Pedobacter insulae]SFG99957.1 beta-galactosidase [Pedobacter insulae]